MIIKFIERKIIIPISNWLLYDVLRFSKKKKWIDYTDVERTKFWNKKITMDGDQLWSELKKFRAETNIDSYDYMGARDFVIYLLDKK